MYNDIETEFRRFSLGEGNVIILRPEVALQLIAASRAAGKRVLGVDAFRKVGERTQPDLSESIDYTVDARSRTSVNTWGEAEQFVKDRKDLGLLFEIVIEE